MSRSRWMFWSLLLALGCHRFYSLDEVPIVGASEQARQIAESELAFFNEAIQPEIIRLSKISFQALEGTGEQAEGLYWEWNRRIAIEESLPVEDISSMLRHELCHALDYQANLANKPHDALDDYAERLYSPEIGGIPWENGSRQRRSEALAQICELGPLVAASLSEPCPDEPPLLAQLATFALAEIWRGVTLPSARPLPIEPTATFAPDQIPFDRFYLQPTSHPSLVQLSTIQELDEDWTTTYVLDPRSGEEYPAVPDVYPLDSTVEMDPPTLPFEKLFFVRTAGWSDHGLAAGFFDIKAFDFDTQDAPRDRLLWSGSEGWSPVPLCLPGSWIHHDNDPIRWDIFTAQDEVWYAETDEQQVWWSLVSDQSP